MRPYKQLCVEIKKDIRKTRKDRIIKAYGGSYGKNNITSGQSDGRPQNELK